MSAARLQDMGQVSWPIGKFPGTEPRDVVRTPASRPRDSERRTLADVTFMSTRKGKVMQTNDIQLVRLYTSKVAGGVQDDTPTELGGSPQSEFYLNILAEAGDNLGDIHAAYTLYLRATSPSGGSTTFTRQVLDETVIDGQFGWTDLKNNNGFSKDARVLVKASDFTKGDVYQFVAVIKAGNGLVSKTTSNEFIA
ncbi:hypothetical protein ACGFI3_30130 [Nonomuraea wenchangensis]